jgi:hypothetical protein
MNKWPRRLAQQSQNNQKKINDKRINFLFILQSIVKIVAKLFCLIEIKDVILQLFTETNNFYLTILI